MASGAEKALFRELLYVLCLTNIAFNEFCFVFNEFCLECNCLVSVFCRN